MASWRAAVETRRSVNSAGQHRCQQLLLLLMCWGSQLGHDQLVTCSLQPSQLAPGKRPVSCGCWQALQLFTATAFQQQHTSGTPSPNPVQQSTTQTGVATQITQHNQLSCNTQGRSQLRSKQRTPSATAHGLVSHNSLSQCTVSTYCCATVNYPQLPYRSSDRCWQCKTSYSCPWWVIVQQGLMRWGLHAPGLQCPREVLTCICCCSSDGSPASLSVRQLD